MHKDSFLLSLYFNLNKTLFKNNNYMKYKNILIYVYSYFKHVQRFTKLLNLNLLLKTFMNINKIFNKMIENI